MPSAFHNRLQKNTRHFGRWAARQGLTAYRVYDRDLPEFPFVVEWYAGRIHLVEFPRRAQRGAGGDALRDEVFATVTEVLGVAPEAVFAKTHLPHPWGRSQYGRTGVGGEELVVAEQGLRFLVNLVDHLDTGLFVDHRTTRARVRERAEGRRVLNLFAYTGAFTVYAAAGGARTTTSVDLSNTYLSWAERNLALNDLTASRHRFLRADCVQWLTAASSGAERWDLVVLDPPPFSTSKGMRGRFDVQRDHVRLLRDALAVLAPGGFLLFSTNFRGFQLEAGRIEARFEEWTPGSLPLDVHQRDSQRCWRVEPR